MENFLKDLDELLAKCRDSALKELDSNQAYTKQKKTRTTCFNELKKTLNEEQNQLLELFIEEEFIYNGMQVNYCYLCGIRDSLNLKKYFDSDQEYWTKLVDKFVNE